MSNRYWSVAENAARTKGLQLAALVELAASGEMRNKEKEAGVRQG